MHVSYSISIAFIITQSKLTLLFISILNRTIPPSLTRSDGALIQLFLEKNHLSGTVPITLADLPYLKDLYIDGENVITVNR